jgi:hypothetical protein
LLDEQRLQPEYGRADSSELYVFHHPCKSRFAIVLDGNSLCILVYVFGNFGDCDLSLRHLAGLVAVWETQAKARKCAGITELNQKPLHESAAVFFAKKTVVRKFGD